MKLGNKIQFGVQAIQAGQKSSTVMAAPQLIANSTTGKFVITSPVSKALNIAVGENIMFLNNIAGVEAAIQQRVSDVVDYCNENGIDIDTREGVDKLLSVFIGRNLIAVKPRIAFRHIFQCFCFGNNLFMKFFCCFR